MASLSFIVGIIGNVISILVFASPIKTFRQVVKKKSTEDYQSVPYITTLLSTSLWTFYGLLKPGGLLIVTVNGAGAVVQFIYVTIFFIYAPRKRKIKTAKLVGLIDFGFLGVVIVITLIVLHGGLRLIFTGVLCTALTTCMYASPLAAMGIVIKTKSVAYMPFLLSFFLFLNASVWLVYAVLVKDFYIGVPNAIGFVLGTAQLIIYAVYFKNKTPIQELEETMKQEQEQDPQDLVKEGGDIEMPPFEDVDLKNKSLNKGTSLPKPSINRQYSLQKIVKTFSLNQYELQAIGTHGDGQQ